MEKQINLEFDSWQKAIDWAIWLTFKDRVKNISYGSRPSDRGYVVEVTNNDNLKEYYKGI